MWDTRLEKSSSTSEENKRIVREVNEAVNSGDWDNLAALDDEDIVVHISRDADLRGRAAGVDALRDFRTAFPDLHVDVEQLVAEGDFVVNRARSTGTHTGPRGRGGPAT